jgi:hypothetical protein
VRVCTALTICFNRSSSALVRGYSGVSACEADAADEEEEEEEDEGAGEGLGDADGVADEEDADGVEVAAELEEEEAFGEAGEVVFGHSAAAEAVEGVEGVAGVEGGRGLASSATKARRDEGRQVQVNHARSDKPSVLAFLPRLGAGGCASCSARVAAHSALRLGSARNAATSKAPCFSTAVMSSTSPATGSARYDSGNSSPVGAPDGAGGARTRDSRSRKSAASSFQALRKAVICLQRSRICLHITGPHANSLSAAAINDQNTDNIS